MDIVREIYTQRKRGYMSKRKLVLKETEQRRVLADVGSDACMLYLHYIAKSGTDNFTYTDEGAAAYLGWNLSKIKRQRLKLVHSFWFHQESGVMSSGRKTFTTYLGKEKVIGALGIENILSKAKEKYTYAQAEQLLDDSGIYRPASKAGIDTIARKAKLKLAKLTDLVDQERITSRINKNE